MTEEAMLVADIDSERARALRLYDEGVFSSGRLRAWLRKLDHQSSVRDQIADSLENADIVTIDQPLMRDEDRVATREVRQRSRIGKFARSL